MPADSREVMEIGARALISASRKPGVGISNPEALVRAALTAIEESGRWKIVPVEPTEEMLEAWPYHVSSTTKRNNRKRWNAMLSASPKTTGGA